jgi:DNA-binding transcriptional MerR regulator
MPDSPDGMTIDELARAAGLVVSTVRLYQNRGLLTPPVKRGRVGYYGAAHLGRLRLIAQLQERGFSLAGIKELLDGMDKGESLRAVLGLGNGPSTWTTEQPESMPLSDLASRLPQVEFDPEMIHRVIDLGLVELSNDGSEVVVRNPSFLHIGSELAALGVPPDVILDEYEKLRTEAARISDRFTDVFRTHLWEPFVESGLSAEQITRLIGALRKLGPLAEAVVVMSLRHALQEAAERFLQAEAERLGVDIPRPGQSDELGSSRAGPP